LKAQPIVGGSRWRRPRPFELAAFASAAGALAFLRWQGLHFGWNTLAYSFRGWLGAIPGLFVAGVGMQLLLTWLGRRPLRAYVAAVWRWSWIGLWLRAWLVSALVAYAYVWLKVSIPLVRPELYDAELWRLDRWLHFGISPTVLAIELVAGTPVAGLMDRLYALWVPTIPFAFAFVFAATRDDLRRNFMLANVVAWSLGAWAYLAVPALGPCYFTPDVLEPVRDAIPQAVEAQRALWDNYLWMVKHRGGMLKSFSPVLGVAAMPSMHVAAFALFALWARRYDRRFFLPFVAATALIFFGSLATAWHYAIDGYAGVLLAWVAVRIADRFEPVTPETDAREAGAGGSAGGPPEAPRAAAA